MSEYIYILWSEHMGDLLKIGKTIRQPLIRAKEISSDTGAPPYVVLAYYSVEDCDSAERLVHRLLEKVRVGNKELFKTGIFDAHDTIFKTDLVMDHKVFTRHIVKATGLDPGAIESRMDKQYLVEKRAEEEKRKAHEQVQRMIDEEKAKRAAAIEVEHKRELERLEREERKERLRDNVTFIVTRVLPVIALMAALLYGLGHLSEYNAAEKQKMLERGEFQSEHERIEYEMKQIFERAKEATKPIQK